MDRKQLARAIANQVCEFWEVQPNTQEWAIARDAADIALRQTTDALKIAREALERVAQYRVTFADNPVTVYAAMQQTARAALAKAKETT
jgi:hypothetical protein